jgi:hypothetical protein
MGALSEFLARGVAVPAVPAVLQSAGVRLAKSESAEPQEPQEPQGVAVELRAHLLRLAKLEGVDAAHVHRLHADDVAACVGESDDTLRTYLRGLERGARMDAGMVPYEWKATAHCAGCGPVYWHKAERLTACPWCFKRKAGRVIPRPPVQCGDCRHYSPDPINPPAGAGRCALGASRGRWPMQGHQCGDMRPPENRTKQGDPLMVSDSVGLQP